MSYTTIFFDLDDTLYPHSNGVWEAIRERMNSYMREVLRLPEDEVSLLRRKYFETYGTTLRGLQLHHNVDAEDFLAYVHDLPVNQMVKRDPDLKAMIERLPQQKHIFTNADDRHALRVLDALGIKACFESIIDVKAMDFVCKPDPAAYHRALDLAGEQNPVACIYLDDSPRNLAPARRLGIFTILIGENGSHTTADLSLQRPHELLTALPNLLVSN